MIGLSGVPSPLQNSYSVLVFRSFVAVGHTTASFKPGRVGTADSVLAHAKASVFAIALVDLLCKSARMGLTVLLLVEASTDLAEPWMSEGLVQRDSLFRFLDQQAEDEILALLRVAGPLGRVEDYAIFASHPDRLLLRVMIEGQRAAKKSVDDAAE